MNDVIDPWRHWMENLQGRRVPLHEGTPFAGFYRTYGKGFRIKDYPKFIEPFTPVAYYPGENGELNCRIGDDDVTPQIGRDLWVSVCAQPVEEENYRNKAERGLKWDDEHELVPMGMMGHNQPPQDTSFEGLRATIDPKMESVKKRLEGPPIEDQAEANQLGNIGAELESLWKLSEESRKAERKPHDDALQAIQIKWAPLLALGDVLRNLKIKLLTPWQLAQEKAQEEEARAAMAAGEPVEPTAARRPRAGTRGRVMTLRTFKRAEITDFDACLNHFKDHDDIKLTVQDLANKAIRAGIPIPGAKLIEERRTV